MCILKKFSNFLQFFSGEILGLGFDIISRLLWKHKQTDTKVLTSFTRILLLLAIKLCKYVKEIDIGQGAICSAWTLGLILDVKEVIDSEDNIIA